MRTHLKASSTMTPPQMSPCATTASARTAWPPTSRQACTVTSVVPPQTSTTITVIPATRTDTCRAGCGKSYDLHFSFNYIIRQVLMQHLLPAHTFTCCQRWCLSPGHAGQQPQAQGSRIRLKDQGCDQPCPQCCLPHGLLAALSPQSRYSQTPEQGVTRRWRFNKSAHTDSCVA